MEALKYAYILLKYRPRSEKEMEERLFMRGYKSAQIKKTLSRLKELDLISDLRFARFWINYRLTCNTRSKFFIEIELKKKGLESEIIRQAFSEYGAIQEEDVCLKLARKKWMSLNKVEGHIKKQRRLYLYLLRRGFKPSLVRAISSSFFKGNLYED